MSLIQIVKTLKREGSIELRFTILEEEAYSRAIDRFTSFAEEHGFTVIKEGMTKIEVSYILMDTQWNKNHITAEIPNKPKKGWLTLWREYVEETKPRGWWLYTTHDCIHAGCPTLKAIFVRFNVEKK